MDGLFGLFSLELGEVFHLLLGELHMGHRLNAVVASDGQQALIGNGGMVDLDMGELGDGGRLEQTGVVQPGPIKGQKVQLAAVQGGQAAAVNGRIAVQQQIAKFGHGVKDGETGVSEGAVLYAEVSHTFMSGKGYKQFIRRRIIFHMEAHQGVTGQPLHEFHSQFRNFKFLFSVQGQNAVFPVRCPRPFW